MLYRTSRLLAALSALFVVPTAAQFGVAGGRRQGGATSFQELQELAKKNAAGGGGAGAGGMADVQQLLQDAMANPEQYLSQLGDMGDQFGAALEQMMKMTPEEMQQQMEQAMKMMTDGDIVENILNNKDEVLASLEASGAVPPEELAKYKADPNYFELKMRESFEQMGDLLNNPEYIEATTNVMKNMAGMIQDPTEMLKLVGSELEDDDKIEEARLEILAGTGAVGGLKDFFDTPEMKEILHDPKKWRETVRDGMAGIIPDVDSAKDEL